VVPQEEANVTKTAVLVVGAGDVGMRAAGVLAQKGHEVVALRRSAGEAPSGVTLLQADITDPTSLQALAAYRFDYVVVTTAAGSRDEEVYRRVYVDGLRNVIAQLQQQSQPPARLVLASSTSVYAQSAGEWVDETSVTEPADFSGRIQLEAERIARDSGIAATVIRFGGIYGPGRERLIRQVQARDFCAPQPPSYSNRIHCDDAARLLAFTVMRAIAGDALAPCYIGVDDEPAPLFEVLSYIAGQLGIVAMHGATASTRGSKRCSNALIRRAGFVFHYPNYRIGYGAMLDASRAASVS